jgi:hypothetical protein
MRQSGNVASRAVRLLLVLALCFGCLIFLETEASAAPLPLSDPLIHFESLRTYVVPGDLCTLRVFVDDAVDSLSCMDITVAFDTSLVECTAVMEGELYWQSGFETFFRWKRVKPDTVNVVDCVLGYRSRIVAPGELVSFVFKAKRLGIGHICLAGVRLWDIDRDELSPVIGSCADVVISAPVVTFERLDLLARPGDLCTLKVLVEDPVDSLSCMDISVTYDTSLVACVEAREGALYEVAPYETFFRWKQVAPDTVDAVDCVLGYRSYIVPPGELVNFVFRAKRDGTCDICFAKVRLWDIDRVELSPVVGACVRLVISTQTGEGPVTPKGSYLCNYPNPFNPSTRLVLYLAAPSERIKESMATVTIYAADGNRVRSLYHGRLPVGRNEFLWDGKNDKGDIVSAGVYFAAVETEWDNLIRKLVVIR